MRKASTYKLNICLDKIYRKIMGRKISDDILEVNVALVNEVTRLENENKTLWQSLESQNTEA